MVLQEQQKLQMFQTFQLIVSATNVGTSRGYNNGAATIGLFHQVQKVEFQHHT
jgi:hypothetical protein